PVISSWSLANATMLPANDTEPMTMLKTLGNTSAKGGCTPNFSSSATATSAAAPPPTPLKRATICGMAVMRTMRAPTVPISMPIMSPTAVISKPACVKWRSGTVAPSAITMPAAAVKLPLRAPLGELSCFRPRMNSAAARRYARAITVGSFFGRLPALEHLEHAVGDDETSDHVGRGEDDRDQAEHDGHRRVGSGGDEDGADQDDAVDRVGARHERRMQDGRHLRDDLEADEDREHEERQLIQKLVGHAAPTICLARSLTISPPCVTHAPLVISSSKSSEIVPFLTRCRRRFATFLANSWLVVSGIVDGTLRVPMIVTPPTSTSLPAWVSSTLPPVSAARSTITEPGRIPLTISPVTSSGALRPGTAAVVITTSDFAMYSPISSLCLRR